MLSAGTMPTCAPRRKILVHVHLDRRARRLSFALRLLGGAVALSLPWGRP